MGSSPGLDFNADAPIYAAIGWFEKECHTTVQYQYAGAGAAQEATLESGAVQYLTASNDVGNQLADIEAGNDNDVALNNNGIGGAAIYFAPIKYKGYGVGINALAKFANLTWGTPSTSGSAIIFNNAALKHDGVNPSSVHFLVVGQNAAAAALAGQCQICISAPSIAEPLIQTGQFYAVWYNAGLQAINLVHYIGNSGLFTTRAYLDSHKSMTEYLLAAEAKGVEMVRADFNKPAKVYSYYPAAAQAAVPYSAFLAGWPFNRSTMAVSGLETRGMMQYLANELYNYRILAQPLTVPADAAAPQYFDAAYKILGQTAPTTELVPSLESWLGNKDTGISS
jgi:ABC-type nitrate/sulfonate/bicarbonate transport system substrate-binding protein